MHAEPVERPLSAEEYSLARWMLEHASSDAQSFLKQLEEATASTWRCPCGCASIDFLVQGKASPPGSVQVLADFEFGCEAENFGAFIFARNGQLAGIEVYGMTGNAPKRLPSTIELRPVGTYNRP